MAAAHRYLTKPRLPPALAVVSFALGGVGTAAAAGDVTARRAAAASVLIAGDRPNRGPRSRLTLREQ